MCISFDKKYVNTYEIQCGNFLFHIHTHLKSINLNAFEQIIANPSIPNFEINIWIDKNIDRFFFKLCVKSKVRYKKAK